MADISLIYEEVQSTSDIIDPNSGILDIDDQLLVVDSFVQANTVEVDESQIAVDTTVEATIREYSDSNTPTDTKENLFLVVEESSFPTEVFADNPQILVSDTYWKLSNVDLGQAGIKTIRAITFGVNGDGYFKVEVTARYNNSLNDRKVLTQTGKNNNVAFTSIAGHTFDIVMYVPIDSNITFDEFSYIIVEYQLNDRRFRRSINVN